MCCSSRCHVRILFIGASDSSLVSVVLPEPAGPETRTRGTGDAGDMQAAAVRRVGEVLQVGFGRIEHLRCPPLSTGVSTALPSQSERTLDEVL
jgi:hypothetical protein